MRELFHSIDQLLRGRFTRPEALRSGDVDLPTRHLLMAALGLGLTYGAFMGIFALLRPEGPAFAQFAVGAVKVPLLFLLTLLVTLPSLYVFSSLANSRLTIVSTVRLLLGAVAVNLALLASFGPVTGFFTLSTDSYPFMVMLNVVFFAVAGFAGLSFLRRALNAVFEPTHKPDWRVRAGMPPAAGARPDARDPQSKGSKPTPSESPEAAAEPTAHAASDKPPPPPPPPGPSAERPLSGAELHEQQATSKRIFNTWTIIYGVVGAQMGWILRPFVGSPTQPFEFFRERDSHFFEAVLATLKRLFE